MSPQSGWSLQEEVVPRLRSAIPRAVKFVGCEDAQELIQDATAFAAKLMDNVERAGKKVTPGNITYYTIQHMKSGRRSTGSTVVDVLGSGTQLNGNTRMSSLDDVVASDAESGGEIFTLNDVLSNDQEDPGTKAARKIDWESFCSGLSAREKMVIEFMVEGKSLRIAANALRVSDSTMQESKRNLRVKILEFMGSDILVEVRHKPQWKDGLDATREKMECRDERRHM
jgi:hypothetical protein